MSRLLQAQEENLLVKRWVKPSDSRIELSNVEYMDNDRIYITINDLFDVRIVRTDEGIVLDVYPSDESVVVDEPVATTYAFDFEVKPEEEI
jgi:hypothetical protein